MKNNVVNMRNFTGIAGTHNGKTFKNPNVFPTAFAELAPNPQSNKRPQLIIQRKNKFPKIGQNLKTVSTRTPITSTRTNHVNSTRKAAP